MPLERSRQLIGGVWRYVSADQSDNGGSQAMRVIGPVPLDFDDIGVDGTITPLFDTTAGDVLANIWYDPATAVNFDDSGPPRLLFGEAPSVHGDQNYDIQLDAIEAGNSGLQPDASTADGNLSTDHYVGGQITAVAQQTFVGGAYKVYNRDGAGDGAAGHIDLYFEVATPTAPVLTP